MKFEVRRGSIVDRIRHNDFESTCVHACTCGYARVSCAWRLFKYDCSL